MIYHSLYSQDKMPDRNNEVLVASWMGIADRIEGEKKNKGVLLASDFIHFIDNNLVSKLEYSLDVRGHVEEVSRESSDILYSNPSILGEYKSTVKAIFQEEKAEEDDEARRERIELYFVQKLNIFKEVEAIYSHKHFDTFVFTAILNTGEYDNGLMEKFFEVEYEIRNEFGNPPLNFNYLPILHGSKKELINPDYKLIFNKNAISEPSLRPSSTQRTVGRRPETVSFLQGLVDYSKFLCSHPLSRV